MNELELKARLIDLFTAMREACMAPDADAQDIRLKAIAELQELRRQAETIMGGGQ